jgi:formiminotetrahydrofolate cyclodeaminase
MHGALLKTLNFYGCAPESSRDEKEIRQDALQSLSTSCEATDNPVRAAIECNDDVASVNAALGQVVHDGC